MESMPGLGWVLMAAAGAGSVVGALRCFRYALGNFLELHDLRVRVNQLRVQQITRLRMLADQNALDASTRAQLLDYAASMEAAGKQAA